MTEFFEGFIKGARETPRAYFAPAIALWRLLLTAQLAVSRQAYDDVLIRIAYYKELSKKISDKQEPLRKVVGKLMDGDGDVDSSIIEEYARIGTDLAFIGNQMAAFVDQMGSQATYYTNVAKANGMSEVYIQDLLKGYAQLEQDIKTLRSDFDQKYLPMFRLISDTSQAVVQIAN